MFLIFIPGVFYKLHLPDKQPQSNLAVLSHFYKVKSFLLHAAVHLFISSLCAESQAGSLGLVLCGSWWMWAEFLCLLKLREGQTGSTARHSQLVAVSLKGLSVQILSLWML